MNYFVEIVIAVLALIGTLSGAFLAHRRSTALLAYRLEQLEKKVEVHNHIVDRTYRLEEQESILEERVKVANERIDELQEYHKPH